MGATTDVVAAAAANAQLIVSHYQIIQYAYFFFIHTKLIQTKYNMKEKVIKKKFLFYYKYTNPPIEFNYGALSL